MTHRAWTLLFRLGIGLVVLAGAWFLLEWITAPLWRAWELYK